MENWFIAKLVYQIVCGDGKHRPQFEEQWRLINATDAAEVKTKVNSMVQGETASDAASLLPVHWQFVSMVEVIPLNRMADGAELLAITREPYDHIDYLNAIFDKPLAPMSFSQG
jgi:hypothetical protein